jgi:hypothetical protein
MAERAGWMPLGKFYVFPASCSELLSSWRTENKDVLLAEKSLRFLRVKDFNSVESGMRKE